MTFSTRGNLLNATAAAAAARAAVVITHPIKRPSLCLSAVGSWHQQPPTAVAATWKTALLAES